MDILLQWGYLGLFIGSFLAATILPLSAEFLVGGLLYAGANPIAVIAIATLGNWSGSLSTYWLGWNGKWEWIERWLKVSPQKMKEQQIHIDKYGSTLAFFVWMPVIGDLFALALGFYKVDFKKCAAFIFIGKFCRFLIFFILYKYTSQWLEF